jgi:hypothetical protein
MADDFQFLPTQGVLNYTVDYSADLAGGATLTAVAWSITPQSGSPLTPSVSGQSNNYAEAQSTITVQGGLHGSSYVLQAIGTTSAGEQIPKDISLLAFNG